jgi:hypothetical protein
MKNKYKIEITQTETFIVDILANNEEQARELATEAFNNGDYQENGDITTDISNVFDITNTDDPFHPENYTEELNDHSENMKDC